MLCLGFLDHAAGLRVTLFDVLLQHLLFNAPLSAAAHLDGFEFTAAYQGVGCRGIDLQLFSNIGEGEESGHVSILPPGMASGAVIHSLTLFGLLTFVRQYLPEQ